MLVNPAKIEPTHLKAQLSQVDIPSFIISRITPLIMSAELLTLRVFVQAPLSINCRDFPSKPLRYTSPLNECA